MQRQDEGGCKEADRKRHISGFLQMNSCTETRETGQQPFPVLRHLAMSESWMSSLLVYVYCRSSCRNPDLPCCFLVHSVKVEMSLTSYPTEIFR